MYLEKPKRPIIWNKGWYVFTRTSILACKFACRSSFHSCLMFKLQAFIFSSSMCNSVVWEDNVYNRYLYLNTLLISLVIWLALVMLPYVRKGGNSLFFSPLWFYNNLFWYSSLMNCLPSKRGSGFVWVELLILCQLLSGLGATDDRAVRRRNVEAFCQLIIAGSFCSTLRL